MKKYKSAIDGHLDIFVADYEETEDGEMAKWRELLIHGDPEGLRSFAKVLLKLADLNQDDVADLPVGAREHYHLRPNWELSKSSERVIVGRIDAKESGRFYDRYIPKDIRKK